MRKSRLHDDSIIIEINIVAATFETLSEVNQATNYLLNVVKGSAISLSLCAAGSRKRDPGKSLRQSSLNINPLWKN